MRIGRINWKLTTTMHAKPKASRQDSAETYLIARGFFAAKPLWILGGIVIGLLYGGLLWGLLPRPGISFTGHLFGAVGGVLAAFALHGKHTREEELADGQRPRLGP